MEPVSFGIAKDPRISPHACSRHAVRSRSSYQRGSAAITGFAGCLIQRIRSEDVARPIPLNQSVVSGGDARVEHVPYATLFDDRAGPGRKVVPCTGGTRAECIRERRPRRSGQLIPRDRSLRSCGAVVRRREIRSLKVEDVVAKANLREPEIPDPTIVQSQHPWSYRRAGGEAITDGSVGPTRAGISFRWTLAPTVGSHHGASCSTSSASGPLVIANRCSS